MTFKMSIFIYLKGKELLSSESWIKAEELGLELVLGRGSLQQGVTCVASMPDQAHFFLAVPPSAILPASFCPGRH